MTRKESFEDYIREFVVHERVVDVDQDTGRLGLDNADVVDTA